MKMNRKRVSGKIVVLSILAVIAMSATAAAQPVPEGFNIAGSVNNYCTDEPVNGATVTITNLNTSEVFNTGTGQLFWWANYRFIIPSDGVSAGNVLHFSASDNKGNFTECNYTVTQDDRFYNGFVKGITIKGSCGDENCDGEVTMGDALATRNHQLYGFSLCNPWAADVNCDSDVTMGDALAIRNHWLYGFALDECCKDC